MFRFFVKYKIVILIIILLTPYLSFAYSPNNTHPDLTEEMAKFYNLLEKDNSFSKEEIKWLRIGAENEDKPPRWINHFYDPVYKIGWDGSNFGNLAKEEGLAQGEDLAPKKLLPSIEWVVNQEYQSTYGLQYGNRTWQRALHSYINEDAKEAFITLGHILHLVEDLSVPDHTRNDPHSGLFGDTSSPYEDYAKDYTNSNKLFIAKELFSEKIDLLNFKEIRQAFEYLADYSNRNFFSADTINNNDYNEPNISKLTNIEKNNIIFLYNNEKDIYLSKIIKNVNGVRLSLKEETYVLPSYTKHLLPKAVLVGASVIDLFFREVEKYKQNPELLEPLVSDSNESFANIIKKSPKIIALNSANFVDNTIVDTKNLVKDAKDKIVKTTSNTIEIITDFISILPSENNTDTSNTASVAKAIDNENKIIEITKTNDEKITENTNDKILEKEIASDDTRNNTARYKPIDEEIDIIDNDKKEIDSNTIEQEKQIQEQDKTYKQKLIPINTPFYGGGGGGKKVEDKNDKTEAVELPQTENETKPNPPIILSPSETLKIFNENRLSFSGTADKESIISASYLIDNATTTYATTTNQSGSWSLNNLLFNQGTTTIVFTAKDKSENVSDELSREIFVDSVSGEVSLSSPECEGTFSITTMASTPGCLVATTTLNFLWSASFDDLDYYTINQNGEISTTTATSTTVSADNNSTFTFSISAKDKTGNSSATTTKEIEIASSPVVINEVAWAGTEASSYDEWIELYNISNKDIDLSNWVLFAKDGAPYLPLSKMISAGDYFLIERTDDDTVSDIEADLILPFSGIGSGSGLGDGGEHLFLVYVNETATTTIDEVPLCGSYGQWCGGLNSGFNVLKHTMERYDPYASDWGTTIGEFILNGKDATSTKILGTPKSRNSINYLMSKNNTLSSDKTITEKNSPYLIQRGGLTINETATLTVEAGSVIKFVAPNEPSLVVNGNLITKGTENKPVVFTSFYDDEYGGDMNNDGLCEFGNASSTSKCPSSGDWRKIIFNNNSVSSLDNTIIRYGGRWFNGLDDMAMVVVDNANINFKKTTIEHAQKRGLYLKNAKSIIEDSIFKNNNTDDDAVGLLVGAGEVSVTNSHFENNNIGLSVGNTPLFSATENTFTNNKNEAVVSSGAFGSFKSNNGSGNGINGIVISGNITENGTGTTTLFSNKLSYIVAYDANINASSTLAFNQGVIVKGYANTSSKMGKIIVKDGGKIFSNGSNPNDLIFTSLHDDSVGSAVDTATTSPFAGDWYGIEVKSGGNLDLSGFTLKYAGGKINTNENDKGGIKFNSGSTTSVIKNALLSDNFQYGIKILDGVNIKINDTTIKNHTEKKLISASGVFLSNAKAELQDIIFENNEFDITSLGASEVVCENCGTPITDP